MEKIQQLFEEPHKNSTVYPSNHELYTLVQRSVQTTQLSNSYNRLHVNVKSDVCNEINHFLSNNGLKTNWDDNLINYIWDFIEFATFTIETDLSRIECTRCEKKLIDCPLMGFDDDFDMSMMENPDLDFAFVSILQPVIAHGIQIIDINISVDLETVRQVNNSMNNDIDEDYPFSWEFSICDDDKYHPRTHICSIYAHGEVHLFGVKVFDLDEYIEPNESIRIVCDVPNDKFVIIFNDHDMTTIIMPFYYQETIKYYLVFESNEINGVKIKTVSNKSDSDETNNITIDID